jgi:protein SCO1/2
MKRSATTAWLVMALVFAGACSKEAAPPPRHAAALAVRLAEAGGRVFDLAAERGRVVIVFFGFTNCPDVCPTTMADFVTVKRRLGPDRAPLVRFAFISVDPARDTPALARRYAAQFDSTFYGLSADSATVAAVQRLFHATSWIVHDSAGRPLVAHSSSAFVVGRDGHLAAQIPANDTRGEALYRAVLVALGH